MDQNLVLHKQIVHLNIELGVDYIDVRKCRWNSNCFAITKRSPRRRHQHGCSLFSNTTRYGFPSEEVPGNKMYFRRLFIPVKIRFYILLICQKQVRSHPNRSFWSRGILLKKLEHYKLVNWRCLRVGPDVLFQLD